MSQDTFTGITAGILRAWALAGQGDEKGADQMLDKIGEAGLADFLVFHRALMAEALGQREKALDLAAQAFKAEPFVARSSRSMPACWPMTASSTRRPR